MVYSSKMNSSVAAASRLVVSVAIKWSAVRLGLKQGRHWLHE